MKDIMKTGDDKVLDFDMLHNVQEGQYLSKISESRWTSRIDCLSWFTEHCGPFLGLGTLFSFFLMNCRTEQMTEIIPMQRLTN